ncbi:hypothetical protein ACT4MK_12295 [Bradyrhizobium barranii]|uniref:hypothetical protein n=1 Tax=Bradyrhizobium TaxID=374 RepID=UPI003F253D8E
MPVLAIGGDHSVGTSMNSDLADVASVAKNAVITNAGFLPNCLRNCLRSALGYKQSSAEPIGQVSYGPEADDETERLGIPKANDKLELLRWLRPSGLALRTH